ncbi:hypothetical protein TcG_04896 [Trypanosoma cruzi]|nr:hypothetical protein TcG_04896 [Trypanosoma cruzi]
MAWRYSGVAGNGTFGPSPTSPFSTASMHNNGHDNGNTGFAVGSGALFSGASANILGAGAFLRSNALSSFGTQKQELDEELRSKGEDSTVESEGRWPRREGNGSLAIADAPPVFGRSQAPTRSIAGALMSNLARKGDILSVADASEAGVVLADKGRTVQGSSKTELLAKKLFYHLPNVREDDHDDDEYEEDGDARHVDREFVRGANFLFSQVDPELLLEKFVPFERGVEIIANEGGTEATATEIDERLAPYYDLQEDIDVMLGRYIEAHHDEFNEAVAGFSKMVLAISGSDEMLARLKQQLTMAAASFDNLAEQLQVLRMRAAKALLMAESLKRLEASLSCESEVKQLTANHHYLAAVKLLRQHKARLEMPEVANIRATQMLRDYVNGTLENMHVTVVENLMSCVFRQGKLYEADAQLVGHMLVDGASEKTVGTIDALVALHEKSHYSDIKADKTTLSFSDVINSIDDDPYENDGDDVTRNYLRFIPLCVKTLQELGKLNCCYETFFSKATRSIEQTIAHFFRLYGAWRQRAVKSTSIAGSLDAATVRVMKLQAEGLASPTVSYDEAIALIQQPELIAMLNALFVQIEKIVRNADYLIKVILVSYFPFLSSCLMKPGGFYPDTTYHDWDVSQTPLQNPDELREILTAALSTTLSNYGAQQKDDGNNAEMVALKRLLVKLDVDSTFARLTALLGRSVCLRDVLDLIDAATEAVIRENPGDSEEEVMVCRKSLSTLTTNMVLEAFRRDVREMHSQWDLQVLSSQLSYYIELIFRVLCDAKELEEDFGDEVALKPFLKHRNLVGRVHRTAELMSSGAAAAADTFFSLEKLLSTQDTSGLLAMMEQTGYVSFSIVAAVKYAQRELRCADEGNRKQSRDRSMPASGNFVYSWRSGNALLLQQAMTLKNWFVFTPMNILTCHESVRQFYRRCAVRAPRFVEASREEIKNSLFHFLQKTYIPSLYVFHLQQLRKLFADMSEAESFTDEASAGEGNVHKSPVRSPSSLLLPIEPLVHHQKVQQEGIKWPIVTLRHGGENGYPILTCVHYVGQVLQKLAHICRTLPDKLAEAIQQNVTETLLSELTIVLKKKFYLISHQTLYHCLLHTDFEEAFAGRPSARWQALSEETRLWDAHNAVDADLFRYYAFNNERRTSGHQYNHVSHDFLGFDVMENSKDGNESGVDASIGAIPPAEIALKGSGVVVALAMLCYSMEWLCDVVLQTVWQNGWHYGISTDCLVPGTVFFQRHDRWSTSLAATKTSDSTRWTRLGGIMRQMYTISQVCLFYLSLEARFAAFQYIPQLRDESYNIVATTRSPDTFVQAYNRRIINFFALLKLHLSEKKLKYVGITVAKPLSELILVEIAHLRDKAISHAGLARLRANLLSIETALQLILPTDDDVRGAVKHYFLRPATFLRHLPNKDVANDLITSGDYKHFSMHEMEELIRLVFRREASDEFVTAQIQLLRVKLKSVAPAVATPEMAPSASLTDENLLPAEHNPQQSERSEESEEEETEEDGEEEESDAVLQPGGRGPSRHVDPTTKMATSPSTDSQNLVFPTGPKPAVTRH